MASTQHKTFKSYLVSIINIVLFLNLSTASAWLTEFGDGTKFNSVDDLAVHQNGNVYAIGSQPAGVGGAPQNNYKIYAREKYTGNPLWEMNIGKGHAQKIAITADNKIITCGKFLYDGRFRFYVDKRDTNGGLIWQTLGSHQLVTSLKSGLANDIEINSQGDIIAVGSAVKNGYSDWTIAIVKLSTIDAAILWHVQIDATDGIFTSDDGYNVSLDSADNIFVTGNLNSKATVIKLNGQTGQEMWRQYLVNENGDANGKANAIIVDKNDDVISSAEFTTGSGNFYVHKLDGNTGQPQWHYAFNVTGETPSGLVRDFALMSNGDIIATGDTKWGKQSDVPVDTRFTVMRLSGSSGTPVWTEVFGVPSPFSTHGYSVAVDKNDNVYVSGSVGVPEVPKYYEWLYWGTVASVRKLSGTNGSTVWHKTHFGYTTYPQSYEVDPYSSSHVLKLTNGLVYIGGFARSSKHSYTAFIMRLDADTGEKTDPGTINPYYELVPIWENEFLWVLTYPLSNQKDYLSVINELAIKHKANLASDVTALLDSPAKEIWLAPKSIRQAQEMLIWISHQSQQIQNKRKSGFIIFLPADNKVKNFTNKVLGKSFQTKDKLIKSKREPIRVYQDTRRKTENDKFKN